MMDQYFSASLSGEDSSNLDLDYKALRREMFQKNKRELYTTACPDSCYLKIQSHFTTYDPKNKELIKIF